MSGVRVNILKDRARAFLELAEELLQRKRLDIASFSVEQACQLRLKATLLRLLGEMPRIHGIRELLGILVNKLNEMGYRDNAEEIIRFTKRYRDTLIDIEEAYTASRYGIVALDRESIVKMISVARTLFELLDRVEKYVMG